MKRKRFTEEQIIGILNEAEQAGNIREVCRLNNITEQTFYRWRTKFGGMDVSVRISLIVNGHFAPSLTPISAIVNGAERRWTGVSFACSDPFVETLP